MYHTIINNVAVTIQKNPRKLTMARRPVKSAWTKGIITDDGDLYLMDYDWTRGDVYHTDLADFLFKNKNLQSRDAISITRPNLFNYLLIARIGNTNNFSLSDSYSPHIKKKMQSEIQQIFDKCEEINPNFKFLI